MAYRNILYHIIFGTRNRVPALNEVHSIDLYKYIWGIIEKNNCVLYRINGMEDHIHILCDLHPNVALANYVRDIKTASSIWLKQNGHFPDFIGWSEGYAALTYAYEDKETILNYTKNQKEHHKTETFGDELKRLLTEQGIHFEEKYLF